MQHEGPAAATLPPRGFVGRDAELAELTGALDQALAGRGRLYLLCGEPGIGKTRLADEVSGARGGARRAGATGAAAGKPAARRRIFRGSTCSRASRDALDDAQLDESVGDGGAALVELVPAWRARLPAARGGLAPNADRRASGCFAA